jgi:hypothetical protein
MSDQSSTESRHWLWQSEQFLIWNDGVNLPIFWDGLTARRSLGSSIASIGTTAAPFTIPAVGQSVSVPVNMAIPSSQWPNYNGLSVLFNVSQYQVASISNNVTNPSTSLTTLVLQSVGGGTDVLLCADASHSALFYSSNQYCGWIQPSGVVQVQNDTTTVTVTDWYSILAPVAGTAYTSVTLAITNGVLYDANYYNQCNGISGNSTLKTIAAGDNITIGGVPVYVESISSSNGVVSSITVHPTSQTNNGQSITGAISVVSHNIINQASQNFFSGATLCGLWWVTRAGSSAGTTTASYTVSSGGTTWNAGTGAINNYFTVQLNNNVYPALSNGSSYSFAAVSSNGVTVNFTGTYNGTSRLVNCQMASPPGTSQPILVASSVSGITGSTPINYFVKLVSPSTPTSNQVATLYNLTGSPAAYTNLTVSSVATTLAIPVTGINSNIAVGSVIYATAISGNVDVFLVTSLTGESGGNTTYATIINQTGTPGNTELAGVSISPIPELPTSTIGVYGMGRNWIAIGDNSFVGGDLVGGASGTSTYNYADAVLKVSQNQFLAGGTTFKIPGSGETIRAMQFVAAIDASLGQGALQVFTDDTVFSCNAPTDITTWATMTSPILTESLIGSGAISQNAVVQSNADLMFRLSDGGIQSMLLARLDFNRWGNTPISKEVSRSISGDDASLIPFTSMIVHDNRVLMTCKPVQSARGVYSPAMVALNFDPISSLAGKATSVWDGEWNGLNVLQFVSGFFNNVKRCFALCLSADLTKIELHEVLPDGAATLDNGTSVVQWQFETPMIFQREQSHQYKRLIDGEIYLDELQADVTVQAYYKVDQNNAWTPWYSTVVKYKTNDSGFRPRVGLGQPSGQLFDTINNRPMREGYDFQVKLVFTGSCRFLGGRFAADIIPQPDFAKPI